MVSPLAYSTRNDQVEAVYEGAIAVVDPEGRVLESAGDPEYRTYVRSSIKMIQAIPVIETGAADTFELSDAELALCCASHTGADYHVKGVQSILGKIGMSESALKCGGHLPENREMRERLIRLEANPTAIYNNCSGKHAGMLAACLAAGWPTESYLEEDHPLQQRIMQLVSEYSGVPVEEIIVGIDGCSLPTYYLPLSTIALTAARFIARADDPWTPTVEDPESASGGMSPDRRLLEAINAHPEMIHAETGFDTVLIRSIDAACYAKRGAMGIMLVGLQTREHGPIGVAIKSENGEDKIMPVVVTALLEKLGALTPEEKNRLAPYRSEPIKNWTGTVVGELKASS